MTDISCFPKFYDKDTLDPQRNVLSDVGKKEKLPLNVVVSVKCQKSQSLHKTTIVKSQGSHFKYRVASQQPRSHYVHKRE